MTVDITGHMKQVLDEQLCFIATASADGTPNLGPKGSLGVFDHKTLVFDETTGGATFENLKNGSAAVIAVVDQAWKNGYRFTGTAEILDSGDVFEARVAAREKRGKTAQIATVLLHLNDIRTFRPVGQDGQTIR